MVLSEEVVEQLSLNGFEHTYTNEYSGTDRFIRKISDLPLNSRIYNNCAIVIESYAENYLTLNVFGYAQKSGFVQNITRDLFPGLYQFIPVENAPQTIARLELYPFAWAREFSL